jgi:hypothetical protein
MRGTIIINFPVLLYWTVPVYLTLIASNKLRKKHRGRQGGTEYPEPLLNGQRECNDLVSVR